MREELKVSPASLDPVVQPDESGLAMMPYPGGASARALSRLMVTRTMFGA